ncbi:DMT family transporter [Candidatus Saccharibacteria bacterium]|nr:DMT family transporter [Candidatus Saccharibacteria bacterium]MBP9131684.1 DMT family transporter [Candidatus Saccharibacteria bacterium]
MWFILALISGLLFAINKLIFRFALKGGKVNALTFISIHELIAGLLILPFALRSMPYDATSYVVLLIIATTLLIFAADVLSTFALQKIEAGFYQIIGQLRHPVVLIGASYLFDETLGLQKLIAVSLVVIGVLIALYDKNKLLKLNIGIIQAILSTVFIAFGFLLIKITTRYVEPIALGSISLTGAGLLGLMVAGSTKNLYVRHMNNNTKRLLLAAAIIFAIFEVVLYTALDIGEASKVTPVMQSSMVFTLVGGYIFLQERSNLIQKIIGSIVIILGITILYFV